MIRILNAEPFDASTATVESMAGSLDLVTYQYLFQAIVEQDPSPNSILRLITHNPNLLGFRLPYFKIQVAICIM